MSDLSLNNFHCCVNFKYQINKVQQISDIRYIKYNNLFNSGWFVYATKQSSEYKMCVPKISAGGLLLLTPTLHPITV